MQITNEKRTQNKVNTNAGVCYISYTQGKKYIIFRNICEYVFGFII